MDFLSVVLGTIVSSAISGIVGNRADAALMKGYQTIGNARRGEPAEVDLELRKAVRRSFLLALLNVVTDCHQELVGAFSRQWQGNPVYPVQHQETLRWLDQKRCALVQELKQLQKAGAVEISLGALSEITTFLTPDGQTAAEVTQLVKQKLIDEASEPDPVPTDYAVKLKQAQTGLFERMCAYFSLEMTQNLIVYNFFTGQILAQINATQTDQQLTLKDLSRSLQNLAQDVPQVIETLRIIEENQSTLWQGVEYLIAVNTTTASGIEEIKALLLQLIVANQALPSNPETPKLIAATPIAPNPFAPITGRIDDPRLVFGRQKELDRIFEKLNVNSSVALIGERAIGKSSLLQVVCAEAEQRLRSPRTPIYLDLKQITDEHEFYEALCDRVGVATCKGYALTRALKSRRVLLVIDEVEKMAWASFTREIRSQLRGLAEGGDTPLRLVLAACQSLDRLFPDSEADGVSPLAGICLEEPIRPWSEATMQAFIADRLANTSVRFSEAEILQLIQSSGGYPQKLMQACYYRYAQYQESQS